MNFLTTIAAMVVAITLLWAIVTLLIKLTVSRKLRQQTRLEVERSILRHEQELIRKLRQKTRLDLEQSILRYEKDYFDYIGHEHPDVIAFKALVEAKDIEGIQEQWNRLATSFVRLETKAGWRGRPLIMDYYYTYEETLAALAKLGT